jgi:large subunit ribosomal protein L24
MNIKKGDTVKVLYGKDSSKNGVVSAVLSKEEKVLVTGVNKVTKHIKGDGKNRKSEIVVVERPMPVAKVMLVCPNCNKPTRVKIERKGNGYVRVCKKCKKEIGSVVKEVKKEVKKETKSKKETK